MGQDMISVSTRASQPDHRTGSLYHWCFSLCLFPQGLFRLEKTKSVNEGECERARETTVVPSKILFEEKSSTPPSTAQDSVTGKMGRWHALAFGVGLKWSQLKVQIGVEAT